jgi:hypothetical protein
VGLRFTEIRVSLSLVTFAFLPLIVFLIHLRLLIAWTLLSRGKCVAIAGLAGMATLVAEKMFAADVFTYLAPLGLAIFNPPNDIVIMAGFPLLVLAIVWGVFWAGEGPAG